MRTPSPRLRILCLVLAASAGLGPRLAAAAVTPLVWDASGRFEAGFAVEPGKFVELCGALATGSRVAWSFTAPAALAFNIHYHVGKEVRFPVQRDGVAELEGTLVAAEPQDYCWMWTNKAGTTTSLKVLLKRLPPR